MKRGTPRHKKMYRLAELLGFPLPFAVGTMEMLWHFAGTTSPRGDIGTVHDQDIAGAVSWHKRPSVLIAGLIEAAWLDSSEEHRLIVHDWPDHCEEAVKKWLKRNKKDFLPVYGRSVDDKCLANVETQSRQMLDAVAPSRGASARAKVLEKDSEEVSLQIQMIDLWIRQYGEEFHLLIQPDADACRRIRESMASAGKTLEDLEKILRQLLQEKQKPKSVGWMIKVLESKFGGEVYAAN